MITSRGRLQLRPLDSLRTWAAVRVKLIGMTGNGALGCLFNKIGSLGVFNTNSADWVWLRRSTGYSTFLVSGFFALYTLL